MSNLSKLKQKNTADYLYDKYFSGRVIPPTIINGKFISTGNPFRYEVGNTSLQKRAE